jgi:hypothetical protein
MKNYVDITDQEFEEADKESHGTMFIVLFTVIDCLDSAVKRSGLRIVK